MGHRNPTFVIFDGDEDKWAYGFMKGWRENEKVDFDFRDAHDLDNLTARAPQWYVKRRLAERMNQSEAILVLVGEETKYLDRFVQWQLELALELGLPIIVAYLKNRRQLDRNLCPPIIRSACAVHVPFNCKAIKYALDHWPCQFRWLNAADKAKGARRYSADVYRYLGVGRKAVPTRNTTGRSISAPHAAPDDFATRQASALSFPKNRHQVTAPAMLHREWRDLYMARRRKMPPSMRCDFPYNTIIEQTKRR